MQPPMRIYLAGPMSGYSNQNHSLFNRAAQRLREMGYEVFNPAENDDGGVRRERSFYMRLDIPAVVAADGVVVLPGWQASRGASLEVWLALDLGIPIYHAPEDGELLRPHEPIDLATLPTWR